LTDDLIFSRWTSGAWAEKLRLTNDGNVGIGTTSPTALLEVNGTAKFDDLVTFAPGQNFATTSGTVVAATGAFAGTTSDQVLNVTQSGTGKALVASGGGTGVYGYGTDYGLYGQGGTDGVDGFGTNTGVYGSSPVYGVVGHGNSVGVWGFGGPTGLYGDGTTYGVYGEGQAYGVTGFSNAFGVYGTGGLSGVTASGWGNDGVGVAGYGRRYGVYGTAYDVNSPGVVGVYGSGDLVGISGHNTATGAYAELGTGTNYLPGGYGVNAYGDPAIGGIGVVAAGNYGVTGYGTGTSGVGSSGGVGVSGVANPDTYGFGVEGSGWTGVYGYGNYGVYGGGNYGVYGYGTDYGVFSDGNFAATGSKSAVVALPDNRVVSLYAVESPDNWFEDFGSAQMSNGAAEVTLDPTFALTVNTEMGYHVFLTPNGDCEGLYVASKTAGGFDVRELRGGKSNITFDYRIVAHRRGYENLRLQEVEADAETVAALRHHAQAAPGRPKLKVLKKPEVPKPPPAPPKVQAPPAAPALMRPLVPGKLPVPSGLAGASKTSSAPLGSQGSLVK
jgi:hypothetical protein